MKKGKPVPDKKEKSDVENGKTIHPGERSYYGTRTPKVQPKPSQKKGKK